MDTSRAGRWEWDQGEVQKTSTASKTFYSLKILEASIQFKSEGVCYSLEFAMYLKHFL